MVRKKPDKIKKPKEEIKRIVRIASTDINGEKSIKMGLRKIKGIGFALANAISRVANLDPNRKIHTLSDREIERL